MSTEEADALLKVANAARGITPYRGDRRPRIINQYLYTIEDFLSLMPDSTSQKFLIQILLRDEARRWIETIRMQSDWDELTGHDVIRCLKKNFYPVNYSKAAIRAIAKILRGSRPLSAYLTEFIDLYREIPEGAIVDETLCVFLAEGCGEPYRSDLRRMNLETFQEVFDYLQRQENTLLDLPGYGDNPLTDQGSSDTMEIDNITSGSHDAAVTDADVAHMTDAEISALNATAAASLACFYCRKVGHLKRDCRKRMADARKKKVAQTTLARNSEAEPKN